MLKTLSGWTLAPALLLAAAACAQPPTPLAAVPSTPIAQVRIDVSPERPRPPFDFSDADAAFLDEVAHGAFNYLWTRVSPDTGMVYDRTDSPAISIGGVGFQLSAIPIGIERGWITREEGHDRALKILTILAGVPDARVEGMFFHFIDPVTGGATRHGYERIVSTVDSALFFAGAITASSYFGGDVAEVADRLVRDANWQAYVAPESAAPHERGFISLGWKATGPEDRIDQGELLPFYWLDAGDEQLLTTFLAVAAARDDHRVDPTLYYRLRRRLGRFGSTGPFVWFPWSGSLFTAMFAHLWIDYGAMGLDDPAALGVANRPRVDWWANTAMVVEMHRAEALRNPEHLPTLGTNAWGLTSCDSPHGYLVPSLFPDDVPMRGAVPEVDYSPYKPTEHWGDGTVAPYGAGMAIMMDPKHAIEALHYYRSLSSHPGMAAMWADPSTGGCGLADSFNLGSTWIAPMHFAIDQGPLLIAIENARTGLVWRLFHEHPDVRSACERLKLKRSR